MHIVPYIFNYLQLHKKVAIAGLGVFYLKRINGFLDEDAHTVYPPAIVVKLEHAAVFEDDFATYISQETQTEIDKAVYHIEKLVRDIRTQVESGKLFILENIGSLELNRGEIKLVKSDHTAYNQDFFGLRPQTYKAIVHENWVHPSTEEKTEEKVEEKIEVAVVETEQPKQDFPTTYSLAEQALKTAYVSEKETHTPNYAWVWIALIVLIAALTVGAIVYNFYPFKPTETEKMPVKKSLSTVQKPALPHMPDSVSYHEIIIAENLSAINAQKLIAKLKTKGMDAHLLSDSIKTNVQISAAKFSDLDSAQAKLKTIQQKYYPKAYLKTIKSIK